MPDIQEPNDRDLIHQIQRGEVDAFGQLYERYGRDVFRFICAHLGNTQDAEDLTEEVFVRVWRALPRYHEKGVPFRAYLLRVSRNALIDFYRRSRRQGRPVSYEEYQHIPEQQTDLTETLAVRSNRRELVRALAQLREDYREVLALRFLQDLSPQETAHVMQRSAGAVRVLQHRALQALREVLEKQSKENDGG